MTYVYTCTNERCRRHEQPAELSHPMSECDRPHLCGECGAEMRRLPQVPAAIYWPGRYWGERDGWFWDTPFTGGSKENAKFFPNPNRAPHYSQAEPVGEKCGACPNGEEEGFDGRHGAL